MEVPRFEELQDSEIGPRREEVGRRTLGAIGGFLLSFFYPDDFEKFTQHFLVFVEKLQKLSLRSLQTLWEYQNRLLLDEGSTSDVAIPLEDVVWKKNMWSRIHFLPLRSKGRKSILEKSRW